LICGAFPDEVVAEILKIARGKQQATKVHRTRSSCAMLVVFVDKIPSALIIYSLLHCRALHLLEHGAC
jgi:hypothetical protein